MKAYRIRHGERALTMLELLVLISGLAIIALMVLTAMGRSYRVWIRVECINNIRMIGLTYREWGQDHQNHFPLPSLAAHSDGKELQNQTPTQLLLLNFMMLSNQISTPRLLHCPADVQAPMAADFLTLTRTNISYFVNLEADETQPQMILVGDDNMASNNVPVASGWLNLTTNFPISWTKGHHHNVGNIGYADGSAQQVDNASLLQALKQTGTNVIRLAIP